MDHFKEQVKRVLLFVVLTAETVVLFLMLWQVAQILLLVFASLLLALFLRSLAELLSRHTQLPVGGSLAVVVLVLLGHLRNPGLAVRPGSRQ
jgi:predicted PurR-regulated permease PerM